MHLHRWGRWVVMDAAVAYANGRRGNQTFQVRECSRCGKKKAKPLFD